MTPKEKAKELRDKFYDQRDYVMIGDEFANERARQCALIAVEEIMDVLWDNGTSSNYYKYWQEVKQEIERL